jgi:hypothetical protein
MVGPGGLNRAAQVSDQWIMRLHPRDRNTASYVGVPHLINLTLTRFVTSRSMIRTGILISGGNGTLARFNQVIFTKMKDQRNQMMHIIFAIFVV